MNAADDDPVVLRFARNAMATTFEVVLPMGSPHVWGTDGLDEIDRLEQQLSVYRDDSEISRLNRLAAEHPIAVEANLYDLFLRCRDWHRESRGAFDIAAGALVKCWGFYRRQGRVPTVEERQSALARSGMARVRLVDEAVSFAVPGVEINLGSVGKGYALDRVARMLRHRGAIAGLVHGGHSSVFALGDEPGRPRGWQVGLSHPDDPARRLGVFDLKDRGLGVSAATHQRFEHNGKWLGHILDPRTAWPADVVTCAAVTAPSAAEADAMATAFYVLGPDVAAAICEKRPELGAVILSRSGMAILGSAAHEFRREAV